MEYFIHDIVEPKLPSLAAEQSFMPWGATSISFETDEGLVEEKFIPADEPTNETPLLLATADEKM
jgi:hypothetical protein